mmetsp:Transcript_21850/g.33854  ORF Transcript_21850/g.33854 Transcript_21850/m.33854 type:complete len:81 (-) Transcript_21850:2831-3073(-)
MSKKNVNPSGNTLRFRRQLIAQKANGTGSSVGKQSYQSNGGHHPTNSSLPGPRDKSVNQRDHHGQRVLSNGPPIGSNGPP